MGIMSFVNLAVNNGRCRCCNSKNSEKIISSYFMHAVLAVVVLLFSLDFSLALQESDLKTHPKSIFATNDMKPRSGIASAEEAAAVDSQQKFKSQRGLLEDITKDGSVDTIDSLFPFPTESKGLFFGEDANGIPIVLGTWFRYGSYTLAFCMFGTAFLVACVASAIYYVLFVVTEPSQQVRSMDNEEGWNVGRVLRALQLAYDTYETFDLYNPSCQLKTVCEVQESDHFQGTLVKRLAHFIIHTDVVQKKMANAADLQAADKVGNDPEQSCAGKFPECRFSINKLYESYRTM